MNLYSYFCSSVSLAVHKGHSSLLSLLEALEVVNTTAFYASDCNQAVSETTFPIELVLVWSLMLQG